MHVRMLPTLLVQMWIDNKPVGFFRALGDSGSETELIHYNAVAPWHSKSIPANVNIVGLGDDDVPVKRRIQVDLRPWFDQSGQRSLTVTLYILPKTSTWGPIYPQIPIPASAMEQPLKGPLADPMFWQPSQVQLLLGIEVLAMLMMDCTTQRIGTRLISQETAMGNMIFGRTDEFAQPAPRQLNTERSIQVVNMQQLEKNLQRLWHFEDLALCTKKDAENELVEQMFAQTHQRTRSGRHVVAIPLNPHIKELGSSREAALRRFLMQEKKFDRDSAYKAKYIEFMEEMIELGHMIEAEAPPQAGEMVYYIPHHGIMSSKRFRVVFDASCLTKTGISLNGAQFVGPRLQRDLADILMRFRRHKIGVSADIKKMFRQVRLTPEQWNLQRIFWRDDKKKSLKEYQLVTVIYGLAASPYLAVKAMLVGAADYENQFPKAVSAIRNDFYMDDCVTGAETESEATELTQNIQYVLKKSGFELDKWRSNSLKLLNEFGSTEMTEILFEDIEQTSILGVKWKPNTDHYTFEINKGQAIEKLTKRIILSKISQLFDPNGYLTPVLIVGKILMQEIWKAKLNWDDEVPSPLQIQWHNFWGKIAHVEAIKIPRWIGTSKDAELQLHGFADSSVQAYGCNVVLRAIQLNGKITCHLIASKSRVAPLKVVTIPRLELAAAELLSQLMFSVRESMEQQQIPYFLWTDNIVALHWIHKPIHRLKLYVANRVRKIQQLTDINRWQHIRTQDNPADLISRGMSADDLRTSQLWWHGPNWLMRPQNEWPKPISVSELPHEPGVTAEMSCHTFHRRTKELEIFVRFEKPKKVFLFDYTKNIGEIKRVLTYVRRFFYNCKRRWEQNKENKNRIKKPARAIDAEELKKNLRKYVPFPTEEEQSEALKIFIRCEQRLFYPSECIHFRRYGNKNPEKFPEKSKILNLLPQIDEDGIMRASSRIVMADLPYDARFPVIIPPHSRLSRALILEAHRKTLHGGAQLMIQYIRANYWITRLRAEIKNATQKCTDCTRHSGRPASQLMANLPATRVVPKWPFEHAGVDYCCDHFSSI